VLKKLSISYLAVAILFLTACSNSSDPSNNNEAAKKCEETVKVFNEKLLSSEKTVKIEGWQIVLDNPSCFLSNAVDIAKTEISALQNQK